MYIYVRTTCVRIASAGSTAIPSRQLSMPDAALLLACLFPAFNFSTSNTSALFNIFPPYNPESFFMIYSVPAFWYTAPDFRFPYSSFDVKWNVPLGRGGERARRAGL